MDRDGLSEQAAFDFIQKTAMTRAGTMRVVAEDIIAGIARARHRRLSRRGPVGSTRRGTVGAAGYCRRRADADADRRELAHLPRLLRAAHRPGHRLGPGHQRGVRLHVDADQPGARPPARPGRGDLRPPRADVPPRAARDLQGQPGRALPTSCASRWAWSARSSRRCASRSSTRRASRPTTSSPPSPRGPATRGDDVIIVTGDRDSYQLVRGPARQGALQQAGRLGLRPLRRGRHPRAHRRAARPVRRVRRPARRPLRQPAGRARGGGEDRGQADQHLRRPRRHLRPRRRPDAEAAPEPRPSTRQQARHQRRADGPGPRRAARGRPRRRSHQGAVDTDEVRRAVRLPRVPHASSAGSPRRSPATSARRAAVDVPEVPVLEAEVAEVDTTPTRRGAAPPSPPALGAGGGGRGVGRRARAQLRCTGSPLVTDPAAGEVAWVPAEPAAATPPSRRSGAVLGRAAPARRPRRQGRSCAACSTSAPTSRPLGARHHARRLPARSGRDPLRARRAAASATPSSSCPTSGAARGPARLRRRRRVAVAQLAAREALGVRLVVEPAARRARRPRAPRAQRRHRGAAGAACSPAWSTSASASTGPSCEGSATTAHRECDAELRADRSRPTPARSST